MLQAVERAIEVYGTPEPAIAVDSRYNGPPGMGNGGYIAGTLSRFFAGPVEVTIRRPVPLDRPLRVQQQPEHVSAWHEYSLIASVRPVDRIDMVVPKAPTFEEAEQAARVSRYQHEHPFPGCFVCGTQRPDGLGILPGRVAGRDIIATTWTPDMDLAEGGVVAPEFVFGALDCPGGLAIVYDDPYRGVLGRITAEIIEPVAPEERYIIAAWRTGEDGRKQFAGTALYTESGQVVARAEAVWFAI